jgi:hypothetical protein
VSTRHILQAPAGRAERALKNPRGAALAAAPKGTSPAPVAPFGPGESDTSERVLLGHITLHPSSAEAPRSADDPLRTAHAIRTQPSGR